jgi:hypothetical protein
MGAAAAAAGGGSALIGGILQGIGQQQALNLSKSQWNQQFGLNAGQYADALASQMQLGGLRDQVVYQLMNNLGQSPSAFNPVNYGAPTNTGQQGVGGYNLNQEAQNAANYTPGAGGTNTNVAQATLGMLGYNNASDIQQSHNAGSTNYSYGGNVYANGTGPLASQTANLSNGYTMTSGNSQFGNAGQKVNAGNNYYGTPYTPAGQTPVGPLYTPPNSQGQVSSVAPPAQHAGYSMGGGTMTPAGPGTSGWGSAPGGGPSALNAALQAGMGNLTNG